MKVYIVEENCGWDGTFFVLAADSLDAAVHHLLGDIGKSREDVSIEHIDGDHDSDPSAVVTYAVGGTSKRKVEYEITERPLLTLDEGSDDE